MPINKEMNGSNKIKTIDLITQAIHAQQQKQNEMSLLIEHAHTFVSARLETENHIGAVVSMKQFLKYESIKEQATRAIAALNALLNAVQAVDEDRFAIRPEDYEKAVRQILAMPPPPLNLDDKSEILARATAKRIKSAARLQEGSRAA